MKANYKIVANKQKMLEKRNRKLRTYQHNVSTANAL